MKRYLRPHGLPLNFDTALCCNVDRLSWGLIIRPQILFERDSNVVVFIDGDFGQQRPQSFAYVRRVIKECASHEKNDVAFVQLKFWTVIDYVEFRFASV